MVFPIVHGTLGEDGSLQGVLPDGEPAVCRFRYLLGSAACINTA
ncbi:hypothetical protein ACVXG7_00230 [Enterobacter hormaechei]